jgi:hypothetical protein
MVRLIWGTLNWGGGCLNGRIFILGASFSLLGCIHLFFQQTFIICQELHWILILLCSHLTSEWGRYFVTNAQLHLFSQVGWQLSVGIQSNRCCSRAVPITLSSCGTLVGEKEQPSSSKVTSKCFYDLWEMIPAERWNKGVTSNLMAGPSLRKEYGRNTSNSHLDLCLYKSIFIYFNPICSAEDLSMVTKAIK